MRLQARNAVLAAQNEAHAAGNDQIRPEHLVLRLLNDPDAFAAKAIVARGVARGRAAGRDRSHRGLDHRRRGRRALRPREGMSGPGR